MICKIIELTLSANLRHVIYITVQKNKNKKNFTALIKSYCAKTLL